MIKNINNIKYTKVRENIIYICIYVHKYMYLLFVLNNSRVKSKELN